MNISNRVGRIVVNRDLLVETETPHRLATIIGTGLQGEVIRIEKSNIYNHLVFGVVSPKFKELHTGDFIPIYSLVIHTGRLGELANVEAVILEDHAGLGQEGVCFYDLP